MIDLASIQEALALMRGEQLSSNNAQWLLDLWRVPGFTMRLTIGTVALMREAKLPCVMRGVQDMTGRDCVAVAVCTSDEWRDPCVYAISFGGDRFDRLVDDVASSVSKRRLERLATSIDMMMSVVDDRMEADDDGIVMADDHSEEPAKANWWLSSVMAMAKNTGWSEHYIIWELPIWRFSEYVSALNEANSDKPDNHKPDKATLAAVELIAQKLGQETNGEESTS